MVRYKMKSDETEQSNDTEHLLQLRIAYIFPVKMPVVSILRHFLRAKTCAYRNLL